jgi:hypothetical protein
VARERLLAPTQASTIYTLDELYARLTFEYREGAPNPASLIIHHDGFDIEPRSPFRTFLLPLHHFLNPTATNSLLSFLSNIHISHPNDLIQPLIDSTNRILPGPSSTPQCRGKQGESFAFQQLVSVAHRIRTAFSFFVACLQAGYRMPQCRCLNTVCYELRVVLIM